MFCIKFFMTEFSQMEHETQDLSSYEKLPPISFSFKTTALRTLYPQGGTHLKEKNFLN